MSTQQVVSDRRRTNLALAALFFGTFALGSAELLVVGVLNLIAADFDVSIPTAGWLVTAYALGMAVGGPILTALTMRLDRKTIVVGAILLYAVANLVAVLIPSFELFIAVRFLTGSLQGVFIAVAFVMGMSIVPPERAGRAVGMIVSGVAVSGALGTPLGTLVGQGLGWQGSFVAIVAFAVVALFATLALVPTVASPPGGAAGRAARHAFAPPVLAVLGLTFLVFTSLYTALTYIVPFLQDVTGISGALLSVFLFVYGAATAVGSFSGGRFADQNATRTLIVATAATAVALLVLYLVGSSPILVALVMLAWGVAGSIMVPSLQLRVVTLAGPGGQLASALPASSANVGIALGSVAGGVALGMSPAGPVITGMVVAVIGIAVAWATSYLRPPVAEEEAGAADVAEPAVLAQPVTDAA